MSKHAIRIPPFRAGRRVRLTFAALAIVTMFVAATLALPSRPAPVAAATDAQPERLHESSDLALAAPPVALPPAPTAVRAAVAPAVAPRAVSRSSEKGGLSKADKDRIAEAATPAAAVTAISEALGKVDSATPSESSASVSAEPALVSPDPAGPGTVTINGCLEGSVNENRFRLTDTEGGDAPRSRSWRTGFLKKQSTSVALVEPPDPHALWAQVGQRVAATGLLSSRELRMTSLRVIGPRCN